MTVCVPFHLPKGVKGIKGIKNTAKSMLIPLP